MNYSKVKKHFSLFMVKKSLKKKSIDLDAKHLLQEKPEEKKCQTEQIEKFLDPITCYHLYGDICYIDKLYENEVGLISMQNNFKSISCLEYFAEHECWHVNMLPLNYSLDSWSLIYDRLMSLGDNKAYNLAQTIDAYFISNKKIPEIKCQKKKLEVNDYLADVEKMFQMMKKSIFFFCTFRMHSNEKGLEITTMGFSKKMVELTYGNELAFVDHLLNFGFFDFLTVETENYFEYVNTNILSVNVKNPGITEVKFQTLDGHWCRMMPNLITKNQLNENGEIVDLILLLELKQNEDFLKFVKSKREEKTKFRNKKSKREMDLENLLNFYYTHDEFYNKNPNFLKENLETFEDENPNKRCGYRIINK